MYSITLGKLQNESSQNAFSREKWTTGTEEVKPLWKSSSTLSTAPLQWVFTWGFSGILLHTILNKEISVQMCSCNTGSFLPRGSRVSGWILQARLFHVHRTEGWSERWKYTLCSVIGKWPFSIRCFCFLCGFGSLKIIRDFCNVLPDCLLSSCGIRPTFNDKLKTVKIFAILEFCWEIYNSTNSGEKMNHYSALFSAPYTSFRSRTWAKCSIKCIESDTLFEVWLEGKLMSPMN